MRAPTPRRAFAALAAATLVFGLLLTGWHRASEVHGRCLEHGEEVDLQRVAGATAVVVDAGRDEITSSGWALRDGDDHCEILAAARHNPSIAGEAPHAALIALLTTQAPAAPAALAPPATAALFRLAPKTSPPRTA